MVTINAVKPPANFVRLALMLALVMAFALHSPFACGAGMMSGQIPGQLAQVSHPDCNQHSHSNPHHACCDGMICISAAHLSHEAATPTVVAESVPAQVVYFRAAPPFALIKSTIFPLAFSPPPSGIPLVIRLNTLLI